MISNSHPAVVGQTMRRRQADTGNGSTSVTDSSSAGRLSCSRCVRQGSTSCDECPLATLVEFGRDGALTNDDILALNRLAAAGLIPPVKYLGAA